MQSPSRQYIHAIFPRSADQEKQAKDSLSSHAAARAIDPETILTEIIPIEQFTLAEHYHHKYRIGARSEVRAFLEATYPEIKAFADSTVATQLNSLIAGPPPKERERILADLPKFGLPSDLEGRLVAG